MLYKIVSEEPFFRMAIDLAKIDAIELTETLTLDRYVYKFNFFKADANDAIISYDVTGIPKKELIKIFDAMCMERELLTVQG